MVSTMRIDVSELRSRYSSEAKKLAEFLEEKLEIETETSDRDIILKSKEKGKELTAPKEHLRVLLKKFLHKEDLKEEFRVITGKESILTIKERKILAE
jgi:hypothetical protein